MSHGTADKALPEEKGTKTERERERERRVLLANRHTERQRDREID